MKAPARSGQFGIFPVDVVSPLFAGFINYNFVLEDIILPAFENFFDKLQEEVSAFWQTFKPIAVEGLFDGGLILAGTTEAALTGWFVPGKYKLLAMAPGIALDFYALGRFVWFIGRMRSKREYLAEIQDQLRAGGDAQEANRIEVEDLVDEVGQDEAAEIIFEKEAKAAAVAKEFRAAVEEKKLLVGAEVQDIYAEFVRAITPKAQLALVTELQAALANILGQAMNCLPLESVRAKRECYGVLSTTVRRRSSSLDALRYLALGLFVFPGAASMQQQALLHFKDLKPQRMLQD